MLKFIYTLFLGLLLALFVGVGVSVFYPAPKAPEYPRILESVSAPDGQTAEQKREQAAFDERQAVYQEQNSTYNRNVSVITLGFAVVFLALGLILASRIDVIADGLLLGGVFTLLYSIGRGFVSAQNTYRFLVITAGLVVAFVLGYLKFIKPAVKKK